MENYVPFEEGFIDSAVEPGTPSAVYFATDYAEANKLDKFYPADSGAPWWQSLAMYGATRAIDSHFGPTTTNKTATPETYAGQNGRTYTKGAAGAASGDSNSLLLIGLAVVALFALS